jgi:hypothetical protein
MLVERGNCGLVFPTKNGQPKLDFLGMAKAVARRAEIPESGVRLHKFRVTFCTRALWAGVDLRTVQSWMGIPISRPPCAPQRDAAVCEKVGVHRSCRSARPYGGLIRRWAGHKMSLERDFFSRTDFLGHNRAFFH